MPKSVVINQVPGKPGKVYYPLALIEEPCPVPAPTELLIQLTAVALNHRDLFVRQHLYPGIKFGVPLLSDGCGIVIDAGSAANRAWLNKRVIINPAMGWRDNPDGPEGRDGLQILGGTNNKGTLREYIVVDVSEVEEAPAHLSDAEAAALPLTGLTAWRALMVKAGRRNVGPGKNILVTGIGGGVALMALAFAAASGADVWVTSSKEEKLRRALDLGAKGGVNYQERAWDKELLKMIGDGKQVDAIIDGAGGDVVTRGARVLKPGGIISVYGMTVGPRVSYSMQAVLRNVEIRGSTMGSRKEFKEMVDFVKENQIVPTVSRTVQGIDNIGGIDGLFEEMKTGAQFGKLVVELRDRSRL